MSELETKHDLIVVGGGPAGSAAAAIAARHGLAVLLLEADRHPRLHLGESLLPGVVPILDEMGALAEVEAAGFTRKTGSTHWNWGLTQAWDLWFAETEEYDHAWLVERARFDDLLFRSAGRAGAVTHQQAAAQGFLREGERVVGVEWTRRGEQQARVARAPLTVDATGQAALLSRELGLRTMIPGLQHHASWAHYEGAGRLPAPRTAQALLAAEERHWYWYFPLDERLTSVGVVFQEDYRELPEEQRAKSFEEVVQANARLRALLGPNARRVTSVHSQRDWSYRLSQVAGPGWLLAGDSSGFIDPILSTGVFLAMHAGALCARAAVAVKGGQPEAAALARYQQAHASLFGDIVRLVRFFYQRNLPNTEYFWESKRILSNEPDSELKPQRAFLALTSGLVKNLELDERRGQVQARREREAGAEGAAALDATAPEKLGFVCARLGYRHEGEVVPLFLLIEPTDPGAPSMLRTRNFDLNCLVPRFKNDALSVPALAPHVRAFGDTLRALDSLPGEPLAAFWRRARGALSAALRALPADFELVRVFGE